MALLWATAAAARPTRGFEVIALGVRGGGVESDLSSYLIRPAGDRRGVMCDAGSVMTGLIAARAQGTLGPRTVAQTLDEDVRTVLVSHAHLDHVAGLLLRGPDDHGKTVMALPDVNRALSENYLNWRAWPNFADRGPAPRLATYWLRDLDPGAPVAIDGTAMTVTAYPLSHGGVESTAFLLRDGGDAMLCLGDTGPDAVEKSTRLGELWTAVAPLVRTHALRGIVIEASYPDVRPDASLFGHLTPRWLLAELHRLEARSGGRGSLTGLTVIVAHLKYPVGGEAGYRATIVTDLRRGNDLGVRFVIPRQGQRIVLPA